LLLLEEPSLEPGPVVALQEEPVVAVQEEPVVVQEQAARGHSWRRNLFLWEHFVPFCRNLFLSDDPAEEKCS
jgi:hypothetical protein